MTQLARTTVAKNMFVFKNRLPEGPDNKILRKLGDEAGPSGGWGLEVGPGLKRARNDPCVIT